MFFEGAAGPRLRVLDLGGICSFFYQTYLYFYYIQYIDLLTFYLDNRIADLCEARSLASFATTLQKLVLLGSVHSVEIA